MAEWVYSIIGVAATRRVMKSDFFVAKLDEWFSTSAPTASVTCAPKRSGAHFASENAAQTRCGQGPSRLPSQALQRWPVVHSSKQFDTLRCTVDHLQ